MGLVSSGQPVPRCAWRANKKVVKNPLSPHRNNPTPHHTTDIVFSTLKKSRHRKRANIPTRANTAKRANTANRANTRKKKKRALGGTRDLLASLERSVRPWPRETGGRGRRVRKVASLRDSGFRRSCRIHRLEQSSVKEIETLEGWGHPFPIESHDVSSYSKLPEEAETTLIRGRLQGTETRLLYRALGGTFHHPNAASPPFRPWLCNLLTEWVLHRHYVPNGGEPKLPPAVLVSL